jgi:SNF2 family DNA or RNA helicase
MTATSILNEPGDLFTQLAMIDPERFNDKYNFLAVFCMQNADGKWVFKPGGEKALMHQLSGRIIKRSVAEVAPDLPKQTVNEILVPRTYIPEDQATIMTQLANFAAIQLEDGSSTNIQAIIALITRERQAATFPAGIEVKMTQSMYDEMADNGMNPDPVGTVLFAVPKDTSSIKLDMAEDKLDRVIKSGKRAVVFSQFKTALVDLERRLTARGLRVARYDGDTNKATRLAIKRDFLRPASGERKTDFEYDIVLANYKTGGVGLTFTEATYMLCLDEEWNPAKNLQAWARIHRIGQTEETTVDILRVEKSIDMWMKTLNEKKRAIVNGFEAEIDMVADLKQYFLKPVIEEAEPQKAITASAIEIDEDFLALLDGME